MDEQPEPRVVIEVEAADLAALGRAWPGNSDKGHHRPFVLDSGAKAGILKLHVESFGG